MSNENFYQELPEFLKKAAEIPCGVVEKNKKNFFDVTGYPHYENVVSNVLQFFLDPTEEHGLNELWLNALLSCYSSKLNETVEKAFDNQGPYGIYDIHREYPTKDNKRIDLLIETNKFVIVIENKIYASVVNPFDEYHKTAEEVCEKIKGDFKESNVEIVEILLTLEEKENRKGEKYNFINVTYEKLFEKVSEKIGKYIGTSDYKWLSFMNEFMNSVKKLYEEKEMTIEQRWNEFLTKEDNKLQKVISKFREDIDNKQEWIKTVQQKLGEGTIYNTRGYQGYTSIFKDFGNEDIYTLESYFRKDVDTDNDMFGKVGYFYICVWVRKAKHNKQELLEKLQKQYSDKGISNNGSWGPCLLIEKIPFKDTDKIDVDNVVNIIKKTEDAILSVYK